MNQILVTEKLYITPEFKRKGKMYKKCFSLCVFLVCLLTSYYIYAEWDRSKNEQISQDMLASLQYDTTVREEMDDVIVVVLDEEEEANTPMINVDELLEQYRNNGSIIKSNADYSMEAIVKIPALDIEYPVLTETSEELLKVSLTKLWGPKPNEFGNYCVAGHNYKTGKMFGKLSQLKVGDIVEVTDLTGRTLQYKMYNRYVVDPSDTSCTSQLTSGKKELTLITCTNYGKQRLVVKCREI